MFAQSFADLQPCLPSNSDNFEPVSWVVKFVSSKRSHESFTIYAPKTIAVLIHQSFRDSFHRYKRIFFNAAGLYLNMTNNKYLLIFNVSKTLFSVILVWVITDGYTACRTKTLSSLSKTLAFINIQLHVSEHLLFINA